MLCVLCQDGGLEIKRIYHAPTYSKPCLFHHWARIARALSVLRLATFLALSFNMDNGVSHVLFPSNQKQLTTVSPTHGEIFGDGSETFSCPLALIHHAT